MKTKPKYETIELSPAQEKSMRATLKPVLKGLGLQPHLGTFATVFRSDRLMIEFQPFRARFTFEDVILAIRYGKYPPGMTARDLAAVLVYNNKRKNETALHLALSMGQLPPKQQ